MVDKKQIYEERLKQAEAYEGYWEDSYDFTFQRLKENFSGNRFSKALEIGCGRGQHLERYVDWFDNVVAIEKDWDKRNEAMEKAYAHQLTNIDFRASENDGKSLDFNSFDLVFVGDSFRHMDTDSIADTLERAEELLKEGGFLVTIVPNLKKGQEKFLSASINDQDHMIMNYIGEEEFEEKASKNTPEMFIRRFDLKEMKKYDGFKVVDTIYFHDTILPSFIDKYADRDYIINLPGLKGLFGSEMMVVLRKT